MLKVVALYIAFAVFMQSLTTIWRVARENRAGQIGNLINNLYIVVGTIMMIAILYLYWTKSFWWSPICLFGFALFIGTFIWGIIERALSNSTTSHAFSLVASPVSAIVCFLIIFLF